ncbi:MAG: hypothetical protein GY944_24540 [bacterium]|nr:hypothetical protein [bacterium]
MERSRVALWLGIAVTGVYLASVLLMPADGFWIYDTALKFIQVRAIAEGGQLALDWPGRLLDPNLDFGPLRRGFYALRADELHSAYSPVFPLLAAPFYKLLGARGLAVLPLLGALAILPAVWKLAALMASDPGRRRKTQIASVLVTAFATPLWFYALVFWEHTPAVALAGWCVLACVRYLDAPDVRGAATVGALAALPIYFRPENYLFALVVLGFAAWPRRRCIGEVLVLGGACVLALLPLWTFHTLALGHPLGLHVTNQPWSDVPFAQYLAERGQVLSRLLFNLHGTTVLSLGVGAFFYVVLLAGLRMRADRLRTAVPAAAALALVTGLVVMEGYLAAPRPMNWMIAANGLFAASPVLVFAFLKPGETARSAVRARWIVLGIVLAFVGVYAVFIPEVNSRGIHWGNRFFLCVYPLLAVLAVATLVSWWEQSAPRSMAVVLIAGALVSTVGLQLYSLVMLHDRKAFVAELNERVRASEAEIVVTDLWFVPIDLPSVFFERPVFFAPPARRARLLHHAQRSGVTSVLAVDSTGGQQAPPAVPVVSDGWLQFSPVVLREARVAPANSGAP